METTDYIEKSDILVDMESHDIIFDEESGDIAVGRSADQEAQLLVLCAPGDMYRYPATGVGLSRYVHSIIKKTDLAKRLEEQFLNDGKKISEAQLQNNILRLSFA